MFEGCLMDQDEVYEYDPDYVISPACSFQEWLEINEFDLEDVIDSVDHVSRYVRSMLKEVLDLKPLGIKHADILENITGIPSNFWLNFEQNYRMGLEAGKYDMSLDILRRN